MKKSLFLLIGALLCMAACTKEEKTPEAAIETVRVELTYPGDAQFQAAKGLEIVFTGKSGIIFKAETDENGKASVEVSPDIYDITCSDIRSSEGYSFAYNGSATGVVINNGWDAETPVVLTMTEAKTGQIVIKELYTGGVLKPDGSSFQMDKYVILYNNSGVKANIKNLCLTTSNPYTAVGTINDIVDGKLSFEDKGYIPGGCGLWYFPNNLEIEPYSQVSIALNGAVDHTLTYPASVDLSHVDYVCYDLEDFSKTTYHPVPSENIPTDHYLLAYKFGQGTSLPIAMQSPVLYVFTTGDQNPEAFGANPDYHWVNNRVDKPVYCCVKIPRTDVLDCIEVWEEATAYKSYKRTTADLDAGYNLMTKSLGHTSYRNVNREATEALPENAGKLVYGYAEDPSGIDAEASMKNGAHIIYQDTNNSTNDFHERLVASLKK